MTENEISYKVIGAAIDIHKSIGLGLLESAYENALAYDLKALGFDGNNKFQCLYLQKDKARSWLPS